MIDIGGQLPLPPDQPGRHVASPGATDGGWGESAPAHILDATALRAWIKHPDFRMVK